MVLPMVPFHLWLGPLPQKILYHLPRCYYSCHDRVRLLNHPVIYAPYNSQYSGEKENYTIWHSFFRTNRNNSPVSQNDLRPLRCLINLSRVIKHRENSGDNSVIMAGQLFYFQSEKLSQFWVVFIFPDFWVMPHKIFCDSNCSCCTFRKLRQNCIAPLNFYCNFIIDKERREMNFRLCKSLCCRLFMAFERKTSY